MENTPPSNEADTAKPSPLRKRRFPFFRRKAKKTPKKETPRKDHPRRWLFRGVILVCLAMMIVVTYSLTRGPLAQFVESEPDVDMSVSLPDVPAPTPTRTPTDIPPTSTQTPTASSTPTPSVTPTASITPTPTQTPTPTRTPTAVDLPVRTYTFGDGLLILSLKSGLYTHLYAYHPQNLPLTRLTAGEWDDLHPAISPDGRWIAFSSNRSGVWDLYALSLISGDVIRFTDTSHYEGHPTWSSDQKFIAYESDETGDLDLYILAVDESITPIRLTDDPGADYNPVWSPSGRQLAFVSTRTGEPDIWIADLDRPDDRFRNVSNAPDQIDAFPAWSPEGNVLAWGANRDGLRQILTWNPAQPNIPPQAAVSGDQPAWSPDGRGLATVIERPNAYFLTAYALPNGLLTMPVVSLPGPVMGFVWANIELPEPLPDTLLAATRAVFPVLWQPAVSAGGTDVPANRSQLVRLPDVEAPTPLLHDIADESFNALREQTSITLGWDFLSTLENAFVPITSPLPPGMGDDWLYTGRAVAVSTGPMTAGWMKLVREDFGNETYWRIFVRARFQDGTQGQPLPHVPWSLNVRYSGDTRLYEQGGAYEPIAEGYWLDFTELARAYGWERVPALFNWRTFYLGARFNEFVLRQGMDWRTSMLELYPPEILETPTPIVPLTPTNTPTRTPVPTITPTPTRTLTPTITPTPTISPTPTIRPTIPLPEIP